MTVQDINDFLCSRMNNNIVDITLSYIGTGLYTCDNCQRLHSADEIFATENIMICYLCPDCRAHMMSFYGIIS